jgi:pimeloyl-ACP methyl ester carboxylesterase
MFGGRPDATQADPGALERFFEGQGMHDYCERMKADHDGAQGPGAWKKLVTAIFDALTTCSYTFDDLRKITAPTLILTGDRDVCCSVEEAVTAYRMLSNGELAILPKQGHWIPDAAVQVTIEFLQRCRPSVDRGALAREQLLAH